MHLKRYFLLIFLATFLSSSYGQDFHYTQYFMSPLGVNPALAGAFNGSYRINGLYRDQFRGVGKAFSGFSINVDAPIIRGIRKQDWIGVGLRMEQNKAGLLGQKLNFSGLGVSYHIAMDKNQTNIFSIGVQYGAGGYSYSQLQAGDTGNSIVNGGLSEQDTKFNTSQGGGGGTSGTPTVEGGSLNDLSVGVLYNAKNPKTNSDFKVGLGVEGVLNPNRSKTGDDKKGIGLNAFTAYEMSLNKTTSLTSGAYYYSNKKASALIVNSIVNLKLKPEDKFTLHAGLGVRNVRAGLIYLGATISGFRVGLGYDLDISSSSIATDNHKSIELGVTYLGKIFKKPKPKPIIYCPRL